MNEGEQTIKALQQARGFAAGQKVTFKSTPLVGRRLVGTIDRVFKNGKCRVKASIKGVEKIFHPHSSGLELASESLSLDNDEG